MIAWAKAAGRAAWCCVTLALKEVQHSIHATLAPSKGLVRRVKWFHAPLEDCLLTWILLCARAYLWVVFVS